MGPQGSKASINGTIAEGATISAPKIIPWSRLIFFSSIYACLLFHEAIKAKALNR
jgi:hypothetical protein